MGGTASTLWGLTQEFGFEAGDENARVFYHRREGLGCSVHGDDLATVGSKVNIDWFKPEFRNLCGLIIELKEPHRWSPGLGDDKESIVLSRIVRRTADSLE